MDMLASAGGYLGLFLGFSFLSMVQVIHLAVPHTSGTQEIVRTAGVVVKRVRGQQARLRERKFSVD